MGDINLTNVRYFQDTDIMSDDSFRFYKGAFILALTYALGCATGYHFHKWRVQWLKRRRERLATKLQETQKELELLKLWMIKNCFCGTNFSHFLICLEWKSFTGYKSPIKPEEEDVQCKFYHSLVSQVLKHHSPGRQLVVLGLSKYQIIFFLETYNRNFRL